MSKITYLVAINYEDLSKKAAEQVIDEIRSNPKAIISLAGGDTPIGTFKELVKLSKSQKIDFSQVTFVSLDEWVGLDGSDFGSCRAYLDEYIYKPLNIRESQINFFDGRAVDIAGACEKINDFLDEFGPLDLCLLGIGVNGHLGFNEPNSPIDQKAYICGLDETTKAVGKKYFTADYAINQGMTLGLQQILASNKIIAIASGNTKTAAVTALKSGLVDISCPVTLLNDHDNCCAILCV